MSDEDRGNHRSEEADPNHAPPEGQSPESQRRGYTPVRLAGFPAPPAAPQPPSDDDTSEDARRDHTGEDVSNDNEPAASSAKGSEEGSVSEADVPGADVSTETATGHSDDEQQARADGDSSESQHGPAAGQHANTSARTAGARLVVPASRGRDGAAGPPQQAEPPPRQPAANDDASADPPASGDLQSDKPSRTNVSDDSGRTKPEPAGSAGSAGGQGRPGDSLSRSDQPISADSAVTEGGAPSLAVSESPNAGKQASERRSQGRADYQQAVADPTVRLTPPEDTHEQGHAASNSGGGGESHTGGESRSKTEPSRPHTDTGTRGWFRVPRRGLAMACAVIVVLGASAAGVFALWPSPEQPGSDATNPQQAGAAEDGQAGGPEPAAIRDTGVRDTGVAFEELSVEGDEDDSSGNGGSESDGEGESETVDVSLSAAVAGGEEMVWTGTAQGAADDGPTIEDSPRTARSISLGGEGSPTSANFQAGFEMPTAPGSSAEGEVQSGVMARTEPGEPVTHATYQRLGPARDEPGSNNVSAQGSYYVADDEAVMAEGSYTDRREDGSNRVVRTYTEDNPATGGQRSFQVAFEAPPGTPIPALVGWQPPEDGG